MENAEGFWSYVHADDEAEGGRITDLARDIRAQYEMQTGDSIRLFVDKEGIEWGDAWSGKIESNLASVAFFIAVLTPRYFMSPECRRELQSFARQAKRLGIEQIVLPLLYVDLPALHEEDETDDLIRLVKGLQWEDWRTLRFAEPSSAEYRRNTARLATRLAEANRRAEGDSVETKLDAKDVDEERTDDAPGEIELMALAEETMPKWTETVQAIGQEIERVGAIMQQGTDDLRRGNEQRKGFASRVIVAQRMAKQLEEPAERVWSLGNHFVTQLHDLDPGIRIILERAPREIRDNPDSKAELCAFLDVIGRMSASARPALETTQRMIDSVAPLEKMSRHLRPVLRRMRQGLAVMVEAREVIEQWVRLIDDSGVECEENLTQSGGA